MDALNRYIRYVLFAGYSHREIGAATNYKPGAVTKAFRRGPSVEFLLRCALATGTPPDKLFELAGRAVDQNDAARPISGVGPVDEVEREGRRRTTRAEAQHLAAGSSKVVFPK